MSSMTETPPRKADLRRFLNFRGNPLLTSANTDSPGGFPQGFPLGFGPLGEPIR